MWADAQPDGHQTEYKWRRLQKSFVIPFLVAHHKVWSMTAAGVPCSSATNIGERKTWTQSEFCTYI